MSSNGRRIFVGTKQCFFVVVVVVVVVVVSIGKLHRPRRAAFVETVSKKRSPGVGTTRTTGTAVSVKFFVNAFVDAFVDCFFFQTWNPL